MCHRDIGRLLHRHHFRRELKRLPPEFPVGIVVRVAHLKPPVLARLRALTRRAPVERPAVLEVGGLRLDPAAHRAWRGEQELDLSAKEFSLLEFFLRHPGIVLTRSQILEAAWDFAYDGTSNVVDQYVTYLRRKIDVPFGRHDIETVRGMGYRLRHAE